MPIKAILKMFINKSVTGKIFNQSKEIYKNERLESGLAKSIFSAAKYGYKELGTIDSIMASIGAVAGAALPIPGGCIFAAEGMLQMSKYGGKCAKAISKRFF